MLIPGLESRPPLEARGKCERAERTRRFLQEETEGTEREARKQALPLAGKMNGHGKDIEAVDGISVSSVSSCKNQGAGGGRLGRARSEWASAGDGLAHSVSEGNQIHAIGILGQAGGLQERE